jgi:hypothetical protein
VCGCGTIVNGTHQNVSIGSEPSGAVVEVDKQQLVTPATVSLARDGKYVLHFSKEGYQPQTYALKRSFDGVPVILGNILWLLPGVVVDFVAGGAWVQEPGTVNVNLVPLVASAPAPPTQATTLTVTKAPQKGAGSAL